MESEVRFGRLETMSSGSVVRVKKTRSSDMKKETSKRRKWLSDDYWPPVPKRNFLPAIRNRSNVAIVKINHGQTARQVRNRRRSSDLFATPTALSKATETINNTIEPSLGPGVTKWLNRFVVNLRRRSLERKMRMEMDGHQEADAINEGNEGNGNDDDAVKALTAASTKAVTTKPPAPAPPPSKVPQPSKAPPPAHNWDSLRCRLLRAKISEALTSTKFSVCGKTYSSLRCLGEGGYSTVYEVFDDEDKSLLALKVVRMQSIESESTKKDLLNEIAFLQLFKECDRVIQMVDHEYVDETLYLLLERGDLDLASVIRSLREQRRLTPTKIRFYWEQMLECVRAVHAKYVVHADLKPANFMVVKGQLKLIDFGLAAQLEEGQTFLRRNFVGGTKDFMSPESVAAYVIEEGAINFSEMRKQPECKAKVGLASDIWALGVILYQLVYEGVAPFSSVPGGKLGKLKALMSTDLPVDLDPLDDLTLMDTLRVCLNKKPEMRPDAQTLLNHEFLNP